VDLIGARNPAYRHELDEGIRNWHEDSAAPGATSRIVFPHSRDVICRDTRGRMHTQIVIAVFPRPGTVRARRNRQSIHHTHVVRARGNPRHVRSCKSGVR
jgi:hypothetical protein